MGINTNEHINEINENENEITQIMSGNSVNTTSILEGGSYRENLYKKQIESCNNAMKDCKESTEILNDDVGHQIEWELAGKFGVPFMPPMEEVLKAA